MSFSVSFSSCEMEKQLVFLRVLEFMGRYHLPCGIQKGV